MLATNNPAHSFHAGPAMEHQVATQRRPLRKRKPEAPPENNERLSKRLSLLNLEQSGTKLYVPVEAQLPHYSSPLQSSGTAHGDVASNRRSSAAAVSDDSMMQLDDSKYKVYIRNLDDELSSESEAEEGNLIFLPDIEKHLRNNRIPAAVLAKPDPDMLNKQLVLYSVPSSLTVPEEHDSVRKAIIEARARVRARQVERSEAAQPATFTAIPEADMMDDGVAAPISQPSEDADAMELD
ncbi:hypothetical protein QBC34DRAFT_392686 [Podospora aff. communis PSN243]|uniref:Uncharacterized protein n=1 Tax=Podospora aff. communis PSN243 TaxID=3040156 RepID=A0AAV9H337_9PEZI|nr:hypothetical protein QBC34DRAFT_392686 [Podospora aff. communis PSN243]